MAAQRARPILLNERFLVISVGIYIIFLLPITSWMGSCFNFQAVTYRRVIIMYGPILGRPGPDVGSCKEDGTGFVAV